MDKKKRNRGIRASREKLEVAMLNAGIRTQTSLADKIADSENLASSPKDTINRVFRGESVSPTTIARIARVLQVEPASLYQEDNDSTIEQTPVIQRTSRRKPVLGKYSLVINCITPAGNELAQAMHRQIAKYIKSTVIDPSLIPDDHHMAIDIARHYQSDGVLTIRCQPFERFLSIQVFLFFNDIEQLIWTESLPSITLRQHAEQMAQTFLPYLNCALGLVENQHPALTFVPIDAQEKYLDARNLLDDGQNEISLQRAQTLLQAALRIDPAFARAHAALADSCLRESWRAETRELLEQAQQYCDQALQLDPQDSYCLTVQAQLYRITGRIPEAIELCQKILRHSPEDVEAIEGLAQTYLEAWNQGLSEINDADTKAQFYARKLVELEPQSWRHHLDLGNTLYNTGQPLQALDAYEASALLNPNELAFINLGVMYLCQNQLSKAYEFFVKTLELVPGSYLGYENLGLYYFLQQDFLQAVEYRKKAIATFLDTDNVVIHQIWGDLADACRLAGDHEQAVESYTKAISIIDRDKLQGYADQAFTAHYYYYYFQLSQLRPELYSASKLSSIIPDLAQFIEHQLSPGAYAKLASVLYRQQNTRAASIAIQKAANICPLFLDHPEIKPIIKELTLSNPELPQTRTA